MNLKDINNRVSDAESARPVSLISLKRLVNDAIKKYGPSADLNFIDTSMIMDMHGLFDHVEFTGDISGWDVSNVENMNFMFSGCPFNGDLSLWDVSRVRSMEFMFECSEFNNDTLCNWDVSNVKNMSGMFESSEFNGEIGNWDVSNVEFIWHMFADCPFRGDLSNWDLKSVPAEDLREVVMDELGKFGVVMPESAAGEMKFINLQYQEDDCV